MVHALAKNADCSNCPIRHRAICSNCNDSELAQLDSVKYYKTYSAGSPIGFSGDAFEFVASVVSGTATLERRTEDGRTQMVGLLFPSDFIGRPGRNTVSYDIAAVSDVTLCCFHRRPFEKILAETPHLQERLLEMALDELDAAREWMLLLGRKTAREKISSLLMSIFKRTQSTNSVVVLGEVRFNLPIGREAMGNFLGLTIETVSRQFSSLKRDGIIGLDGNRTVIIRDLARLMEESGDDSDGGTIS